MRLFLVRLHASRQTFGGACSIMRCSRVLRTQQRQLQRRKCQRTHTARCATSLLMHTCMWILADTLPYVVPFTAKAISPVCLSSHKSVYQVHVVHCCCCWLPLLALAARLLVNNFTLVGTINYRAVSEDSSPLTAVLTEAVRAEGVQPEGPPLTLPHAALSKAVRCVVMAQNLVHGPGCVAQPALTH